MTNLRTEAIETQIVRATELKRKILSLIRSGAIDDSYWARDALTRIIDLSTEGFNFLTEQKSAVETDRLSGMLSGPLFTSTDFPIPTSKTGKQMVPVVQLDLRDASRLSGLALGNGLLQVWFDDIDATCDVIRVIERDQVNSASLTDFNFNDEGHWILSENWPFLENGGAIQIVGYESAGIGATDTAFYSSLVDNGEDACSAELVDLLKEFDEIAGGGADLFAGFYGIQYSAADFECRCLISIHEWGSQGRAQVFYEFLNSGVPRFSFKNCAR